MSEFSFTNSDLVSFKQLYSIYPLPKARTCEIDTITIQSFIGEVSVQTMGTVFNDKSLRYCPNYGIGFDGKIGLYIEEGYVSKFTSDYKNKKGRENDKRAVTIAVSCTTGKNSAPSKASYKSLVNLLVDICQRNNIDHLRFLRDKSLIGKANQQNMTLVQWFNAGNNVFDYFENGNFEIAKDVNAILDGEVKIEVQKEVEIEEDSDISIFNYKVKKGDTLESIAQRYQTNCKSIAEANYLAEPYIIYVNQKIKIPVPVAKKKSPRKLSNVDVAKEVAAGKWGEGIQLKVKLKEAGYNYDSVMRLAKIIGKPR